MPLVLATAVVVVSLTGFLALVPALLSSPDLAVVEAAPRTRTGGQWLLVRSSSGSWYLNGDAVSSAVLARSLRQARPRPSAVLLLPSSARTSAAVAADLSWLRRQSNVPIRLERPEGLAQP